MSLNSPFKLELTIHGAENLPIADWTTSDPFVTISIGGRLEGRTKTVYRNRNPTWNELFILKLLHRRSVVILKVFDEDKGKDDDLMGSVVVDVSDASLDEVVQKKYPVIGYGNFDTKASKVELSFRVRSNESVIRVVADNHGALSPCSPSSTVSECDDISAMITKIIASSNVTVAESTVNALTRFVSHEKRWYLSEDLLRDFLLDAHSLKLSQPEAIAVMRNASKKFFNRTRLRLINASKIVMSTRACFWHPPLPKNTVQLNLCANDSKFVAVEFHNRLSMWVFVRWITILFDHWHGRVKTAMLPSWCANKSYSAHCNVQLSDSRTLSGWVVLHPMRPYELRVGDEKISFDGLHNLIVSADTLVPKSDILDVEIVSYSATGEDEEALAHEAHAKKGVFQTVRQGIRGTLKGVATGAVSVVSGVADTAVHTTIGVASTTVGAARSLASGKPIDIIHTAQDNLFAVGKDIRGILKDATAVLGGASTYIVAKFDNIAEKVQSADHFYADCNQSSFSMRPTGAFRRSSFGQLPSAVEDMESVAVAAYPDVDKTSSSVSLFLCHGNDIAQMVIGHKRVSAAWLKEKVGQNTELRLDGQVGYSITLINSRGLQLTPPGKMKIGGGGMHVKMKFTDKHGNSGSLGRLQELKTQSITPTPNPDWKDCSAVFKAQDGFENAAFLRVEICLDDFTTNFVVGTCFIPLGLFRKKSKEITLPMTRYKLNGVHARSDDVLSCLGETTMRIYRMEEGCGSPATVRLRVNHLESNMFNTRWYCECVPAGTINTEGLRDLEPFSLLASQEGLELVSAGQSGLIHTDPADLLVNEADKDTKNASEQKSEEEPITPTDYWNQVAEEANPHANTIIVFENQRRQPYYPFDWSTRAYTRPLFSDETFDIGYTFEKRDDAVLPAGLKWTSEWCLDKKFADTDDNGWTYGLAFRTIVSGLKKGKSHSKPQGMMARRRKWVRKVSFDDRSSMVGQDAMKLFQLANSGKGSVSLKQVSSKGSMDSNGEKGAESPVKSASPPLDSKHAASWRSDYLNTCPNAFVFICKERQTAHSNVQIPWNQVKDAYVITPSILSLYVEVHRYMPSSTGGTFRPAEVEIFVSNCPAAQLKSIVDERKWFCPFKGKIRNLAAAGTISGLIDEAEAEDERLSETEDYIPDTEELSLGSELIADLDENSILLEDQIRKLNEIIGKHNSIRDCEAEKEKSILLRRDCRLRVYMAALFGLGLQGNHNFEDSEVRSIMDKDFKASRGIRHDTEVATANNRIEFYLDTAEKRIRDAVLCGWKHRGGKLERCLEIFANGYFIEIVGLLGSFFEDTGADQVKGLGSKVGLINTYLKHNDRLATILDHALRPYALHAEPAATLSLFLDFDILVSWYTSVLLLEMRDRVNDVINVWSDKAKDVTGNSKDYKYPIPWVPQRTTKSDTQVFTAIPEDLVEVLLTYLQFARIHKDNVAPSFVASIGRLDAEVLMAYTSSFLYLSEQLRSALSSRDWSAATAEDELGEYAIWLSSVANDARRVEIDRLHSPNRVADAAAKEGEKFEGGSQEEINKEDAIEKRTVKAFRRVTHAALDHLACIVFLYVFHERQYLLSDDLYKAWADTLPEEQSVVGQESPNAIIPAIMEDVAFFLQDRASFLDPYCYWQLVSLAVDKVFIIYLSVFKSAQRYGAEFTSRERQQMIADIEAIKSTFVIALGPAPSNSFRTGASLDDHAGKLAAIKQKFVPLELCCKLLEHDLASAAFDDTMKAFQALAEKNPLDAAALAALIETFLGIKGVKKYAARKKTTPRKSESGAVHAAPTTTASTAAPVNLAAAPTPASAAKRRGSMFDYFRHAAAPAAPTVPISAESSHGRERSTSPPPAPVMDNDEDEDDAAMMLKAKQQRETALVDCIAVEIQAVRLFSKLNNSKHFILSKYSPLERVFGSDRSSEFPLNVQILHSANPPSSTGGASSISSTSYFKALKGLFGVSRAKSVRLPRDGFSSMQGSPMSPHSEDGAELSLGQISISNLKVEDLFYLDSLRSPHPYLKVHFGNYTQATKMLVADTSADWSGEEPILVPLRGVGTSESAKSSLAQLYITLYYKGLFTDQVIGTIEVEFAPYAPPMFTNRRYVIEDFKSTQAIQAAKRASDEGRNLPSIILSVAPANSAAAAATAAALATVAENPVDQLADNED